MKKAVLFLILILAFATGCACPAKIPAPMPKPVPRPAPTSQPSLVSPQYAIKLAEKFAPVIYLKGEGELENYEPEPIEILVDDAVVRDIQDPAFSEKASLASLLRWPESVHYLDIAGLGPTTQSPADYQATYEKIGGQYQPTLYVRVKEGNDDGYTVVQYWIFYFVNDWRNFHEGDWELVQLQFPPESPEDLLEGKTEPVFVAFSQHQYGQQMTWNDMITRTLVEGTHPIVYVARGSHANYFLPGNPWAVLDFDDTGLSSWRVMRPEELKIVLLPEDERQTQGLDWVDFRGRWGEYLGLSVSVLGMTFMQAGPFGPLWADGEKKSDRWANPTQWASQLPQYPAPFWSAFLKMLGDPAKLAIFSIFSPAELHVYDAQGRHIGPTAKGDVEKQIPDAIYVTAEGADYKTILIPNADITQEYRVEAKGTGIGRLDLRAQVPDVKNEIKRFLEYLNVPVTPKTTARASVKPIPEPRVAVPPAPVPPEAKGRRPETVRDETTVLEIDSDGDGVFELKKTPGDFEKVPDKPKPPESVPAPPASPTPTIAPTPAPAPPPPRPIPVPATPNKSIVVGKVIAIRSLPGNMLCEITIEVQSSQDVPGYPNVIKEKIGQQISVQTEENSAQLKAGQVITAHIKLEGDERSKFYYAWDIH